MSPDCAFVRPRLEAFVDASLPEAEAKTVRAHLKGCAECRLQHDLAAGLPGRLRSLPSPPPPPSLVPEVMRQVGSGASSRRLSWALLAMEAAIAGLVLAYLSGLNGLVRLATGTARDVSQLFGWSLGSASPPSPATTDLFLTLAAIVLVAISGLHLVVLGRPSQSRPRPRPGA